MTERHINLSSQLNQWYLESNGTVFLRNDGIEVGIQAWMPEACSVTTDQVQDTIQKVFEDFYNGCTIENARIRCLVFHRPINQEESLEIDYPRTDDVVQSAMISQEKFATEERIASGIYKTHEIFFFLHIPDMRSGVSKSSLRSYSHQEFDEIMLRAENERARMMSALQNAGIQVTTLAGEQAFQLMRRYYNLGQIGENPPQYDWNARLPDLTKREIESDSSIRPKTLRSQIINSDILTSRTDYLENGGVKIVVSDMLNGCTQQHDSDTQGWPGMADQVLSRFVDYTYIYVVDAFLSKESKIKSRISRRTSASESIAEDMGNKEDLAKATKSKSELFQTYMEDQRFLRMGMSMIVVVETDQQVRDVRNRLINAWAECGNHQMSGGTYTNWDQFLRLAPYSGQTTDFLLDQTAEATTYFLPFYGPWLNLGGETLALFENTYGGQQRITLPKQSEAAPHIAVTGSSRSGKSFTIQKILMTLYMMGGQLRIMDIKDDYGPLASWLKGQFIPCYPGATFPYETIGPDGELQPVGTPVSYNIFAPKPKGSESLELNSEDRRDIVGFLKALIAKPLDKEENSLLVAAVDGYTNIQHEVIPTQIIQADGTIQTVNQRVYQGGLLGDFAKYLHTLNRIGEIGFEDDVELRKVARRLSLILQNFTHGYPGMMFNRDSTLNIQSRVTVFDLSAIRDDPVMLGVMSTIINKSSWDDARRRKDHSSRIVLVAEESGITGQVPEVKELLNTVVLGGAAYNLMLIAVAQNYEHIQALDGVLNNISRIIMGRCEASEARLIAEMLEMNSEQEQTLKSLRRVDGQYNELFIREAKPGGVEYGKIRFRANWLDLALFSSDAKDKTLRNSILNECGGDMNDAVYHLIEEKKRQYARSF